MSKLIRNLQDDIEGLASKFFSPSALNLLEYKNKKEELIIKKEFLKNIKERTRQINSKISAFNFYYKADCKFLQCDPIKKIEYKKIEKQNCRRRFENRSIAPVLVRKSNLRLDGPLWKSGNLPPFSEESLVEFLAEKLIEHIRRHHLDG